MEKLKVKSWVNVGLILFLISTARLSAANFISTGMIDVTNTPINVKDFGARGDGVSDDTDAIIAAIAGAKDGLLEFPRGTYRITKTIDILLSENGPIGLAGRGASSRIIMEGDGPAFRFTGTHNGTAGPATITSVTSEKERMPLVYALEITGNHPDANGLEFRHTIEPVVNSVLINNVHHGIHLTSRNRNVIITNSHIYNCSGIGIFLDSVNLHQTIISNNHISYNRQGGIRIARSEIFNCQITGNDIEYNCESQSRTFPEGSVVADIWIDCSQGGVAGEGTISGNTIQALPSPGGANIRFTGPFGNNKQIGLWSITGNHISSQMTNIHLDHAHSISITGNTFMRGYNRHLMFENSSNVIVSANVFDYNLHAYPREKNQMGGILISMCENLIFTDNIIDQVKSETGGAVTVTDSKEITIKGCHISNPKYSGIQINSSVKVWVTGCRVFESDKGPVMLSAIELNGTCSGTVIDNNYIGRGRDGDILNRASGVILKGNITHPELLIK